MDDDFRSKYPPEKVRFAEEYLKVGQFLHLSPSEFEEMDSWLIDYVNSEIDRRLAQYAPKDSSGSGEEGKMPLDYYHLGLLLALSQLFGGSEDN